MAGLRISVFDNSYLQAAILAIRAANNQVEAEIRNYTKAELQPAWQQELNANAETKLQAYALAETARVEVSNQNVRLSSATVNAHLSGGLDVKTGYAAIEFGADRNTTSTYTQRSRSGHAYKVTRHNHRQFLSPRRNGYLVYPTAASLVPRFASLWVQTAMRTIADAVDAGRKP